MLTLPLFSVTGLTLQCLLLQHHQLKAEEPSHKVKSLITTVKSICTGFSTPEKKLFCLFCYYILVVVILLAFFTAVLQQADSTSEHLHNYISCSTAGYKPVCDEYKQQLQSTSNTGYILDIFATMLLCSVNLSNLTYVLQFYTIKQFCSRVLVTSTQKSSIS